MNEKTHIKILVFTLAALLPWVAYSQPGRKQTPDHLRHEEKFVDAQKQKLLGNNEEAIKILENLLQKVDTIGGIYYELGQLHSSGGSIEKALKNIDKAVEYSPSFLPFWEAKAEIEVKAGKDEAAARSYGHLVEMAPGERDFYEQRARTFERMDSLQKSIRVWQSVEDRFGVSETTIRKKHKLYHRLGNTAKAEEVLLQWTEAFPQKTRPLLLLAQYRDRVGKTEEARSTYEELLAIDPDNSEAKLALLSTKKTAEDAPEFLKSLKPIVEDAQTPLDVKIKQLIPYVKDLADGDTSLIPGLTELAEILRRLHESEAKTWSISGDIAYYKGNKKKAARYYDKTTDLNPRIFPVWEQLLRTLSETHQYELLAEQSENARDYFPNQGSILYFKGLGLFGTGAWEEANSILEEGLIMTSASPQMQADIYALLSKVALRNGNRDASRNYFEQGLGNVSNHPDLLLQKAYFLIQSEQGLPEAADLLDQVENLVPQTVEVAHLRGWLQFKKGRIESAAELLSQALEASEFPSPELLEHYGDVLNEQGQYTKAKKYWQQAVEQGGNRSRIEQKMQALPK